MSVFTNINLGLRYVLPIFPYVFVSAGKLGPWASGFARPRRGVAAWAVVGLGLAMTAGRDGVDPPALPRLFQRRLGRPGPGRRAPDRQQPRLGPGPRQPPPLARRRTPRASGSAWRTSGRSTRGSSRPGARGSTGSCPPPRRGRCRRLPPRYRARPVGDPARAGPLRGQRVARRGAPLAGLRQPAARLRASTAGRRIAVWFNAFGYFRELTPVDKVGYSIWIYRVTPERRRPARPASGIAAAVALSGRACRESCRRGGCRVFKTTGPARIIATIRGRHRRRGESTVAGGRVRGGAWRSFSNEYRAERGTDERSAHSPRGPARRSTPAKASCGWPRPGSPARS